ncbi:MAG: hypothetical protein PHS16_01515 [Candidatus Colwellbacteria bacterium]|jgi:hypothetical protein|nr:hypothetical protein [Candidatus Colwellbacteria bacterium]MCK9497562.1 hypothetical protein [Candidatus Colwellbacteria bacterium]MDD3752598.1 hypothetical protein [Candidatus Colwellbacteria bacterium]MDD4818867.1 hypothetical protein [Candidatus Colwellbacteria bacterium]
MGIVTEYNPDLALRNISEFKRGNRKIEECIPENMKVGEVYDFLKKGQRNYWIEGEIPLLETKGNQQLSSPLGSIIILEATHFMSGSEPWTKGSFKVIEIFDKSDKRIHFNGFDKINY